MAIAKYISITTLNINGLNAPTKRHRLAEWTWVAISFPILGKFLTIISSNIF